MLRLEYDMLDATPPRDLVRKRSAPQVNARIDEGTKAEIERNLRGGREAVFTRLDALDREWDIDRSVVLVSAGVAGACAVGAAAARGNKHAFGLLGAQIALLGLHALIGWSPATWLLRRAGVRTRHEIEQERHILLGELERAFGVRG